MRKRHQYRMLQAAFVFALIGMAFFGSYQGVRYSEKAHANTHAQHGGEKKHPTPFTVDWFTADPVAFATFALVFVTSALAALTGGLYIATAALARDSRDASAKALAASTEATNLARRQFVSSHRPDLKIHFIRILPFKSDTPPDMQPIRVQFEIINAGATECTIVGSGLYLEYLYEIDRPYLPVLGHNGVVADTHFDVGQACDYIVEGDQWSGLNHFGASTTGKRLYFSGWVLYTDNEDRLRTTYVCREYDPARERFVHVEEPEANSTY